MASSWYNTVVLQMNDMFTPGAKITDTGKKFRARHGHDGKGNKLTTLLGEAKALEAIKAGVAKQSW